MKTARGELFIWHDALLVHHRLVYGITRVSQTENRDNIIAVFVVTIDIHGVCHHYLSVATRKPSRSTDAHRNYKVPKN